ncbi:hypothetical protein D9Q98_004879 [Chlorella vulgaris]|uniref:DUF7781 domain-containing protein n=1 Tax=Chlorella vulgaris TaxID=3077 RepID=A0A9D4TN26_CHLVU|nr:hypothetical protein D9Q98_004879 [Chlorella vulgaris]
MTEISTLADLLERFTVDAQPECTLKLRTKTGPFVVGADLTRVTAVGSNTAALVIKPSRSGQLWRRLRIDNSGTMTLRSRKLQWWLFTLDVIGHANPLSRSFDLTYRLATKWDISRGEYRNKRRYDVSPKTEARAHWSISYSLPAVEGSLGAAAQQAVSREVHADVGYAHLSIPRVELVVWPRGRPNEPAELTSSPAAAAPASSSMDAAVAAVAGGVAAAAGEAGPVAGDPQACSAAVEAAEGAAAGSGAALALVPVATPDLQPGVPLPLGASAASEPALGGGAASGTQRKRNGLAELQGHITELTGRWWDKVVQR